jgi:hypothetical protein
MIAVCSVDGSGIGYEEEAVGILIAVVICIVHDDVDIIQSSDPWACKGHIELGARGESPSAEASTGTIDIYIGDAIVYIA